LQVGCNQGKRGEDINSEVKEKKTEVRGATQMLLLLFSVLEVLRRWTLQIQNLITNSFRNK